MLTGEKLIRRGLLIGGRETTDWNAQLEVVNPATGSVIANVASADAEDVDRAVQAARSTFEAGVWRGLPIHERAGVLNQFADAIAARMTDLWRLETMNNGRPVAETRAQISRLPEWYRYNAALLLADRTSVVPMAGEYHSYTSRFPVGVVGILGSFNHPLMIPSKSLAPALATGNSVVLKPSELTPLTALLLGDLALEAGVPPGVLNVVPGLGSVAGAALSSHPLVAKVVFTGGTEAGRAVALAAAGRFAKCTVELGGKTPVLMFADTPAEVAVRGALFGGSSAPARPASPEAGSSCRSSSTTSSWTSWSERPQGCASAPRTRRAPNWDRSSRQPRGTGSSTTYGSASKRALASRRVDMPLRYRGSQGGSSWRRPC